MLSPQEASRLVRSSSISSSSCSEFIPSVSKLSSFSSIYSSWTVNLSIARSFWWIELTIQTLNERNAVIMIPQIPYVSKKRLALIPSGGGSGLSEWDAECSLTCNTLVPVRFWLHTSTVSSGWFWGFDKKLLYNNYPKAYYSLVFNKLCWILANHLL